MLKNPLFSLKRLIISHGSHKRWCTEDECFRRMWNWTEQFNFWLLDTGHFLQFSVLFDICLSEGSVYH